MKVNRSALNHAKRLIRDGKVVHDSDWSEAQASADDENRYLDEHGWDGYARWFLAEDGDENEETKERYKFPYGDLKKVHRQGVIAAKQRAAQNDYGDVEKAADELLELIDKEAEKDGG